MIASDATTAVNEIDRTTADHGHRLRIVVNVVHVVVKIADLTAAMTAELTGVTKAATGPAKGTVTVPKSAIPDGEVIAASANRSGADRRHLIGPAGETGTAT